METPVCVLNCMNRDVVCVNVTVCLCVMCVLACHLLYQLVSLLHPHHTDPGRRPQIDTIPNDPPTG